MPRMTKVKSKEVGALSWREATGPSNGLSSTPEQPPSLGIVGPDTAKLDLRIARSGSCVLREDAVPPLDPRAHIRLVPIAPAQVPPLPVDLRLVEPKSVEPATVEPAMIELDVTVLSAAPAETAPDRPAPLTAAIHPPSEARAAAPPHPRLQGRHLASPRHPSPIGGRALSATFSVVLGLAVVLGVLCTGLIRI
jgi:hypothetical protein